jgi:translation initiation factor 3 subunit L
MVRCREIVGEYGGRPLYRMLGYFSIIGLLRVHVLLGDFTLALKVMENVELNQKVRSARRYCQHNLKGRIIGTIYTRHCLPRRDVLLCRLLLHHASSVSRRHSLIRDNPQLHIADATIPHS